MVSSTEAIVLSVWIVGMAVILEIGNHTRRSEGRNEKKRESEGGTKKWTERQERKISASESRLVTLDTRLYTADRRLMALESKLDDALTTQARIQENMRPRRDRTPLLEW